MKALIIIACLPFLHGCLAYDYTMWNNPSSRHFKDMQDASDVLKEMRGKCSVKM